MNSKCYKKFKRGCVISLIGVSGLALSLSHAALFPRQVLAAEKSLALHNLESRFVSKEYAESIQSAVSEYVLRERDTAAKKAVAEAAAKKAAAEAAKKAEEERVRLEKKIKNGGALDWFKKVQYIFPRESDARVTDVVTGKSFNLRRTYGRNHADVEPLTTEDSKIIKEIWGGWSWERRAVIVEVGDYLIAGSMTAFPHAGVDNKPAVAVVNNRSGGYGRGQNLDSVKNNGIDGHMDIHFLNSRTHGTNQMQKVHQDMIKAAAAHLQSLLTK